MPYQVAEVFTSIQGEGAHTGTPAAFIRLHGCSVGCPWCDTPYSWKEPPRAVDFETLVRAEPEQALVCTVDHETLGAWVREQGVRHVVITGGEPLEQDLGLLLARLSTYAVQVETSGTVTVPRSVRAAIDWLTVSPKIGMPGGRAVLPWTVEMADEIKMPVGRELDITRLEELLASICHQPPVWLQPLSLSSKATALCLDAARRHGWRVSLQAHRLAALR